MSDRIISRLLIINLTILECKFPLCREREFAVRIINLTILECKFRITVYLRNSVYIINLTILECKSFSSLFSLFSCNYNKSNHIGM